eukprot:TRINITY_DN1259_c0_g1_i19.p1 TRINITY_DN1259_c0_g1~~TRINITY_DN1259_c0_g1_i19.p1  ORF type:complete len:199 (+),score=40.25 TRINITY_DN1259_c0_g1_i19:19-615(+)
MFRHLIKSLARTSLRFSSRMRPLHQFQRMPFCSDKKKSNLPPAAPQIPPEEEDKTIQTIKVENVTVKAEIGKKTISYTLEDEVKGTNLGNSGVYMLMLTCGVCNTKMVRTFSKQAYHTGVVLLRCEGCEKVHLIADNLGWFEDNPVNVEDLLKRKGEKVIKIKDHPDINRILSHIKFAPKEKAAPTKTAEDDKSKTKE